MNTLAIDYWNKPTGHNIHVPISAFKKPENELEYKELETLLGGLVDEVRDNEDHPLALVMQAIGDNLEDYDDKVSPSIGYDVTAIEALKYIMKRDELTQGNPSHIFGSQGNVSSFLNKNRSLTVEQIKALSAEYALDVNLLLN